jgi:hypothetical protein
MELFLTILLIACALTSFICLVIAAIGIAEEYGILLALLGVFCCQIVVFAWGWIFWQNEIKWYVMPIWTIAIIAGGILRYQLYGPSY